MTLEIETSAAIQTDLSSVAQAGSIIEAFSFDFLPDFAGKTIEAIVQLTGDTMGTRWQISSVSVRESGGTTR